MADQQSASGGENDRLILLFLGVTAMVCIIGIVVLAIFKTDAQPLVAIASAAVGALATKITGSGGNKQPEKQPDDDFAILGRAATKSIIAEAMRQMGASSE